MGDQRHFSSSFLPAIIMVFYGACALAAGTPQSMTELQPPAGQVCPQGSFVIGFDNESNILCSETCGNRVQNNGEACDDGNTTNGDGCSAMCQSETPAKVKPEEVIAAEPPPAPPASTASTLNALAQPVISKIKPSTVVFGSREVTVTISGTGFSSETAVLFNGTSYTPTVNQAGTELKVTLATRELEIGRHAITISNGPGMEITKKKGLTVF
jgi:cysteine-rich repeat protein